MIKSKNSFQENKINQIRFFKAIIITVVLLCIVLSPFLVVKSVYRRIYRQTDFFDGAHVSREVQFGTYPQTMVKDAAIIAELTQLKLEWKFYEDCYAGEGFYGTMKQTNCMKYADVELDGYRYRAVLIEKYRPSSVLSPAIAEESWQDENGFLLNKIYWFLFEPIQWIVLNKNSGLIISEKVLDAMPFNDLFYWVDRNFDKAPDIDKEFSSTEYLFTPANLYKSSSLRRWLNNNFFLEAFSIEEQKAINKTGHIVTNIIDNSSDHTKYGVLSLNFDKVFLLSLRDALIYKNEKDEAAVKYVPVTDYARCRGVYTAEYNNQLYTWQWLCSPGDYCGDVISVFLNEGLINCDRQFFYAYALGGIRCMTRLNPASFNEYLAMD